MIAPARIGFRFREEPWELQVYETVDRHGDRTTRVAAYCLVDALPRGPRRAWSLIDDRLEPWHPRPEGDWPELDAAARMALDGAHELLSALAPRRAS